MGEHLLCKQGVSGSIPLISTNLAFESWLQNVSIGDEENKV